MKRIEAYEIINHGVEHSDYFQGCGVACTEFTDVATGIGNSEREALDDAIEQLAQGDWDVDDNMGLVNDLGRADNTDEVQAVIDEYGDTVSIGYDAETPYVHVSVRVR
jgi:hypothetical protein